MEEDTEKLVQSIGPIHPDTREAEFKHLKKGNYLVYLEIHVSPQLTRMVNKFKSVLSVLIL